MKSSILFFSFSLLFVGNVLASDEQINEKNFDKYCYLEDKAYSPGSRVEQKGKVLQCKRNEAGSLVWQKPDRKNSFAKN